AARRPDAHESSRATSAAGETSATATAVEASAAIEASGAGHDAARVAGDVYAANTIGAIVGALLFSLLLIPAIGTQNCQRLLIGLSAVGATLMGLVELVAWARRSTNLLASWAGWLAWSLVAIAAATLTAALIRQVPVTPADLIAYGRYSARYRGEAEVLYLGEGLNSSVAVTLRNGLQRSFHVSGKVEASSVPQDMRLQRMLGHIPALVHPAPKSVLIVGCGAGVTAGSFILHPTIERIVICELEPLIPQVVAHHFDAENHGVVTNPKVEIVYDDARHFILTTTEQFDIITSDPIHPWVRGAAALYTREYFELCKRRLKPGGVVTQWVPLYESNLPAVQSELATFFDAFPQGTVWSNDHLGSGYDLVLLGQQDPLVINLDDWNERLAREDHWFITFALEDVGFFSSYDLLATYAGRASDLENWLAKAERNHDRNLRLQYLAAVGANEYQEDAIYRSIVKHRSEAAQPFVGSASQLSELKHRWANPTRTPQPPPRK
ncbi:MAG: spermidine synthase, partial [Planctomycetota bacterium]